MYMHRPSLPLKWECSKKKDGLVQVSSNHANDKPGKCTNGIYLTSNVLQLQESLYLGNAFSWWTWSLSRWLNLSKPGIWIQWCILGWHGSLKYITEVCKYQCIKSNQLMIKTVLLCVNDSLHILWRSHGKYGSEQIDCSKRRPGQQWGQFQTCFLYLCRTYATTENNHKTLLNLPIVVWTI